MTRNKIYYFYLSIQKLTFTLFGIKLINETVNISTKFFLSIQNTDLNNEKVFNELSAVLNMIFMYLTTNLVFFCALTKVLSFRVIHYLNEK
jgi:hypothetical protein